MGHMQANISLHLSQREMVHDFNRWHRNAFMSQRWLEETACNLYYAHIEQNCKRMKSHTWFRLDVRPETL